MHTLRNFIKINTGFTCKNCRKRVKEHPAGGCRNHCPFCLFSFHLDSAVPGDREGICGAFMVPIFAEADHKKGAILTHQCQQCGHRNRNRVAPDDNWDKICELSRIPH
ncbi:RNHCP domain-containing protein [Candidatus Peregrinibacteria bacterium]|nr:RNHCP domain-containing protein [Candidatus Peregrinibacteria bacterium]